MKKILYFMVLFLLFPMISFAYNLNTEGMSKDIANLIEELEKDWPSGLDEGRLEIIRQAGLMINKGTTYGGHTGICYTNKPPSLDCSAYVSLAFHRAGVTEVGCEWFTGSYNSSSSFDNINQSDLRPGDIGLNNSTQSTYNHVGIYVGKRNGNNIWFHSSTVNGVSGPQVREGNGNFAVFKRYNKWNEVHVSSSSSNPGIGGELGGRLDDPYVNMFLNTSNDFNCENIFYTMNSDGSKSEKTLKVILDWLFNAITFVAPIIAIILTIIDYMKIISNNSSDGLKKANIRMIKRMVIAILIVFLPFLLQFLFNIFGLYDLSNCGIS